MILILGINCDSDWAARDSLSADSRKAPNTVLLQLGNILFSFQNTVSGADKENIKRSTIFVN